MSVDLKCFAWGNLLGSNDTLMQPFNLVVRGQKKLDVKKNNNMWYKQTTNFRI